MAKRVLAVGCTGLIGKELIEPLQNLGFEIYGITIDEINPNNGVNWIFGNIFDEDFVKKTMEEIKPEYLLNMAWATTGDYLTNDINYKFLTAGINLLKYFRENGGKRAVCAGTCFEYKFKNELIKETDELDYCKNPYTFCKNQLREFGEFFSKQNGLSFGWGRIFYVYGANEAKTRLTGALLDKLPRNEKVLITAGPLLKDYIFTKDIAGAFAKFLDSDVQGAVNICTGKPITIKDYVTKIAQALGKEEYLVFEDKIEGQPPMIVGDNSRLTNEVGYKIKYEEIAINELL